MTAHYHCVNCQHNLLDFILLCENEDCDNFMHDSCADACEQCGKKFCKEHLVTVDGMPVCHKCEPSFRVECELAEATKNDPISLIDGLVICFGVLNVLDAKRFQARDRHLGEDIEEALMRKYVRELINDAHAR